MYRWLRLCPVNLFVLVRQGDGQPLYLPFDVPPGTKVVPLTPAAGPAECSEAKLERDRETFGVLDNYVYALVDDVDFKGERQRRKALEDLRDFTNHYISSTSEEENSKCAKEAAKYLRNADAFLEYYGIDLDEPETGDVYDWDETAALCRSVARRLALIRSIAVNEADPV